MRSLRAPFLLLAACLALYTLGGAHASRVLAENTGGESNDACFSGFRQWLTSIQTCDPSVDPTTCCAPLTALGIDCLGSVFSAAEASGDPQTVQAMTVLFQGCGITVTPPASTPPSTPPTTSTPPAPPATTPPTTSTPPAPPATTPPTTSTPPAPPTSVDPQCAASFDSVAGSSCASGSTLEACCPALQGVGTDCLVQVVAVLTAAGNTDALASLTGVMQSCNIQLPTTEDPAAIPQECVDGFNQAADVCKTGSITDCCTQLAGLTPASCLSQVLDQFTSKGDTASATTLNSTLQTCGIPLPAPAPSTPGGVVDAQCIDSFKQALGSCASAGTDASCCASVSAVDTTCLSNIGAALASDAAGLNLFNQIMTGCGITLSGGAPPTTPFALLARSMIATPYTPHHEAGVVDSAGALLNTVEGQPMPAAGSKALRARFERPPQN